MIYANFDPEGVPLGFYNEDIHGPLYLEEDVRNPGYPEGVIEITESQWMDFLTNPGLRRWVSGSVEVFTPPAPPVSRAAECTPAQGQMALYQAGFYDAFNEAVAASPYVPLKIYAASATKWEIVNPYIQAMQAELELSDDQVQALFDLAVML